MKTNIIKFPLSMRKSLGLIKDNDNNKTNVIEVITEACDNLIKESKKKDSTIVFKETEYNNKAVTEVNLALDEQLHADLKVYAITCGVKNVTLRKVIFFACQRLIDNAKLTKE